MKTTGWTPTMAWLAAAAGALVLAFVAPSDLSVMGRVPTISAKRLDQQQVVVPQQIPAERSLALIAYTRGQREEINSWIQGLRLDEDKSISWFRMPVINDPGTAAARNEIEAGLLARHPGQQDRARLVPLFTNRDDFVRATGLSGIEHASVLVIDREGRVLARAEGFYDEEKAQALRQTLVATR